MLVTNNHSDYSVITLTFTLVHFLFNLYIYHGIHLCGIVALLWVATSIFFWVQVSVTAASHIHVQHALLITTIQHLRKLSLTWLTCRYISNKSYIYIYMIFFLSVLLYSVHNMHTITAKDAKMWPSFETQTTWINASKIRLPLFLNRLAWITCLQRKQKIS